MKLVLAGFLVLSTIRCSQEDLTVYGTVTDKNGIPLQGVSITVTERGGDKAEAVTDEDGYYSIFLFRVNALFGTCGFIATLDAVKAGYLSYSTGINSDPCDSQPLVLNFSMEPE